MTKREAIWFAISMASLFGCIGLAALFGTHPAWWRGGAEIFGALAALAFVNLMAGTIGITVGSLVWNGYVRRTGTPVVGAVVHARPAGYVNHIPNYQLELALSDGRTGRMQMQRFSSFHPGERLELIAGRGNPARTVLPAEVVQRPSF